MSGSTETKWTPTIAVDFDGVIHAYTSPWTHVLDIRDPPVEGAFAFIREAQEAGFNVVVHTARANDEQAHEVIWAWFCAHGFDGKKPPITAQKVAALVYIDDRGFRFEGTFPTLETIRSFKQWNKA